MNDVGHDELAELRRRVYGRPSKAGDEQSAASRLASLERERAENVGAAPNATAAERIDTDEGHVLPAEKAPRRRRIAVLWVASVVVAAAATGSTALWLDRRPAATVAVIELGRSAEPLSFQPAEGTSDDIVAGSFHGLSVARVPWSGDEVQTGSECLSIIPANVMRDGVGVYGCGAGTVPATVPMNVTTESPSKLRDEFPLGTTLVFVLDGDLVGVHTSER